MVASGIRSPAGTANGLQHTAAVARRQFPLNAVGTDLLGQFRRQAIFCQQEPARGISKLGKQDGYGVQAPRLVDQPVA